MIRKFDDDRHVPTTALQIYLILIGLAWNRQTITYGALSQGQMGGYGQGGVINRELGCVMGWCYENGLPALTALVVRDDTGIPGEGLVTVEGEDFPAAQQRVFRYNWFQLFPPTIQELKAAGERAQAEILRAPA